MVKEIRIYVEGGGNRGDTKAVFRQGMSKFLCELKNLSLSRGVRWQIIACGSRDSALQDFQSALKSHPTAFNLLLIDAEAPVSVPSAILHLQQNDKCSLGGITADQCHLMVEVMENWFLADIAALESFYGQQFNPSAIPPTQNVEAIGKARVEAALENATRATQKGRYHKIQHGTKLLEKINPTTVRSRAPYCNLLFEKLKEKIES